MLLLLLFSTSVNSTSIEQACGNSYQCYYDYSVTLNRQYGVYAKYYLDEIVNIKSNDLKKVISCGVLPAPKHGRKSTFAFTPGTFVKFECDPGYVLTGEERRWCYASAEWNWAVWGEAECIRKSSTILFIRFFLLSSFRNISLAATRLTMIKSEEKQVSQKISSRNSSQNSLNTR